MVAIAYGASFSHEEEQFSESITPNLLYIKTINCKEQNAINRIIAYHRKVIAFAIQNGYIRSQIQKVNPSIESLLISYVNITYQQDFNEIVIYIRSNFIDSNTYLKHQINVINSGYYFHLYMAL